MNETLSLPQITARIAQLTGADEQTVSFFIKEFIDALENCLAQGHSVKLKNFGHFFATTNDIRFIPDTSLAEAVNQPFAAFEAIELPDYIPEDTLAMLVTLSEEHAKESQQQQQDQDDILDELGIPTQAYELEGDNLEEMSLADTLKEIQGTKAPQRATAPTSAPSSPNSQGSAQPSVQPAAQSAAQPKATEASPSQSANTGGNSGPAPSHVTVDFDFGPKSAPNTTSKPQASSTPQAPQNQGRPVQKPVPKAAPNTPSPTAASPAGADSTSNISSKGSTQNPVGFTASGEGVEGSNAPGSQRKPNIPQEPENKEPQVETPKEVLFFFELETPEENSEAQNTNSDNVSSYTNQGGNTGDTTSFFGDRNPAAQGNTATSNQPNTGAQVPGTTGATAPEEESPEKPQKPSSRSTGGVIIDWESISNISHRTVSDEDHPSEGGVISTSNGDNSYPNGKDSSLHGVTIGDTSGEGSAETSGSGNEGKTSRAIDFEDNDEEGLSVDIYSPDFHQDNDDIHYHDGDRIPSSSDDGYSPLLGDKGIDIYTDSKEDTTVFSHDDHSQSAHAPSPKDDFSDTGHISSPSGPYIVVENPSDNHPGHTVEPENTVTEHQNPAVGPQNSTDETAPTDQGTSNGLSLEELVESYIRPVDPTSQEDSTIIDTDDNQGKGNDATEQTHVTDIDQTGLTDTVVKEPSEFTSDTNSGNRSGDNSVDNSSEDSTIFNGDDNNPSDQGDTAETYDYVSRWDSTTGDTVEDNNAGTLEEEEIVIVDRTFIDENTGDNGVKNNTSGTEDSEESDEDYRPIFDTYGSMGPDAGEQPKDSDYQGDSTQMGDTGDFTSYGPDTNDATDDTSTSHGSSNNGSSNNGSSNNGGNFIEGETTQSGDRRLTDSEDYDNENPEPPVKVTPWRKWSVVAVIAIIVLCGCLGLLSKCGYINLLKPTDTIYVDVEEVDVLPSAIPAWENEYPYETESVEEVDETEFSDQDGEITESEDELVEETSSASAKEQAQQAAAEKAKLEAQEKAKREAEEKRLAQERERQLKEAEAERRAQERKKAEEEKLAQQREKEKAEAQKKAKEKQAEQESQKMDSRFANGPVYDVVTTTRSLSIMAAEYYGSSYYWVYIYDANPYLGNPREILPGTKVKIPPLNQYVKGSPKDSKNIHKAQRRADEINNMYPA